MTAHQITARAFLAERWRARRQSIPTTRDFRPETGAMGRWVHLYDLQQHHCRAVQGEPKKGLFCGKDVVPNTSWCPDHFRQFCTPNTTVSKPKTTVETQKSKARETV